MLLRKIKQVRARSAGVVREALLSGGVCEQGSQTGEGVGQGSGEGHLQRPNSSRCLHEIGTAFCMSIIS